MHGTQPSPECGGLLTRLLLCFIGPDGPIPVAVEERLVEPSYSTATPKTGRLKLIPSVDAPAAAEKPGQQRTGWNGPAIGGSERGGVTSGVGDAKTTHGFRKWCRCLQWKGREVEGVSTLDDRKFHSPRLAVLPRGRRS